MTPESDDRGRVDYEDGMAWARMWALAGAVVMGLAIVHQNTPCMFYAVTLSALGMFRLFITQREGRSLMDKGRGNSD